MTIRSITSITDGQKKQYFRFVEDAAEKALKEVGLDKDGIQKLIEKGDEFQARIVTGIRELSVSNQSADEEVESSYAPPGYKLKDATVRLADGVLFQELEGEAVLLSTRNSQYYGLNELGARIWQGLTAGQSMAQVLSGIMIEYQVDEERLVSDVTRFLTTLEKIGLVRVEYPGR